MTILVVLPNPDTMKYSFSLLLIFIVVNSVAQVRDIPTDNVKWVNNKLVDYSIPPNYYYAENHYIRYCMNGEDTVINSIPYTKVKNCLYQEFYGGFRTDNGKAYYIPKDSVQEYLVYDFTGEIGDTIFNVYYEIHGQTPVIENLILSGLDSLYITSEYRTIFEFTNGHSWFEGIGGSQGFLWDSFSTVSNTSSELKCHSYGDSIMQDPTIVLVGGCDLTVGITFEDGPLSIDIFPNPTQSEVQVSLEAPFTSTHNLKYVLTDLQGRGVLQESNFSMDSPIDLSSLKPGVYLFTLYSGLDLLGTERVVIDQ